MASGLGELSTAPIAGKLTEARLPDCQTKEAAADQKEQKEIARKIGKWMKVGNGRLLNFDIFFQRHWIPWLHFFKKAHHMEFRMRP